MPGDFGLVCQAGMPDAQTSRSEGTGLNEDQEDLTTLKKEVPQLQKRRKRQADSSDWISSQLTRRFG